jgi:hypothetical protein
MKEKPKKNLSLDPKILKLGEQLAQEDRRDFSAQVAWLIEQESKRREESQKKAA